MRGYSRSQQSTPCLGVAQLVARYLGVVEAVGSSPVTQTIFVSQMIQCKNALSKEGAFFYVIKYEKTNDYCKVGVYFTQNRFAKDNQPMFQELE